MTQVSFGLTKHHLEELLRPTLDADGTKIKDFSVRYLTKPGDNYGSTMLAVDVILTPYSRTLPLVAKMLPVSTDMRELFQVEKSVRKEVHLYTLVRPAFEILQKENKVPDDKILDIVPFCYGARISSEGDAGPVDDTSVILQENLKVQGYECGDRCVGLNLAHCQIVVDKLARFHATAVALKIKKPEEFKTTVIRAANPLIVKDVQLITVKPLENIPEYNNLKNRIDTAILKSFKSFTASPKVPREPFATIAHLDLWTNNIMFQYEPGSSKDNPKSLKIVDFQLTRYDSPARDLLFFLYSSAQIEVLSKHYDNLVTLYYASFVDCLRILGCDTSPFSFNDFLKEIENAAEIELFHIAFMMSYISLESEDAVKSDDLSLEHFNKPPKYGRTYIDRARKLILDFASRQWI